MRVILYTGKGGVGKTSVAAATALRASQMGYKTVVMSTDAAHSLGDCFDVPLSGEPRQIAPNLWGQEVDIFREMEAQWRVIRDWVTSLMQWRGIDEIVADELAVFPGMEELASLLYITHYHEKGEHDLIIVDCAPTGETLRLLTFPEMARWYMDKIFPIERKAVSAIGPLIKPLTNVPIPDNKVFDSIQFLFEQVNKMRTILTDPDTSSVRMVVNPEKMVIKETQRTFTYLNLYGYFTDMVVCNRVIPDEVDDPYFVYWKKNQERYYRMIEESFAPLPILKVPLLDQEVVGFPMLERMAKLLFGEEDPSRVFFRGRSQEIIQRDDHYILSLPLPLVAKEDISLMQHGSELIVQAGRYRRNIILPRTLVGLSVIEAKFEDNKLELKFEQNIRREVIEKGEKTKRRSGGHGHGGKSA